MRSVPWVSRKLDLSRIPAGRLKALARHAASSWAAVIARMPRDRRVATLLAFARAFEATALDDALDLLDLIITDLLAPGQAHRREGTTSHTPRPGCGRSATPRSLRGSARRGL